jgi:cell division septation protein DedD
MERNRVLWVIFSISLFLVVVLAAGLYFLRPTGPAGTPAAAREAPRGESFDAFEYVRGRSGLPGLREEGDRAEEMVIIVGEPAEPDGAGQSEVEGEVPVAREIVPAPSAGPARGAPTPAEGTAAPTPGVPAARTPTARTPAAAGPVERPRRQPTPAPRPAPKRAPAPVRVTEYWIQVGSFSSRSRADELADSLSQRGLAPKVTTRLVSGATHYRVRIGPYPNRSEAGKFLEWVKALEGLEGSYISMVTVQRPKP